MTAAPARALPSRALGRPIRPPDPAVSGTTLSYMPIGSSEACRRLLHLAFRDAHSALDLTFAAGRFWRDPLPPELVVTSNDWNPAAATDLHVDFRATGLEAGSFDLVVYDPPHVADGGASGIMTRRYGSIRTTSALRDLIVAGAVEAWRLSSVGIVVKVTEHHHGGRFLNESAWIESAIPSPLYTKLSTVRSSAVQAGRWRAERVPRSNGAVYLVFRRDGGAHVDFDALYRRQVMKRCESKSVQGLRPERCSQCFAPLDQSTARRWRRTCSPACRLRAFRARKREAR